MVRSVRTITGWRGVDGMMRSGTTAWRNAPCGTTPVMFDRMSGSTAIVYSRGQRSKWAQKPITIDARDLFATREEALAEYRRRREALHPGASLNLSH
jgi:hypothetical protein